MHGKLKFPLPLLWIIGVGFLLYARSLFFDYTNFDDNVLIQDNQGYISNIANLADAFKRSVFITGSDVFYRPIETVWFILNAQIGGSDLFIYHLSAILLHLLCVYLIFILLRRFNSEATSLFLSLVFLVHPLFAQAVAWVPGVVDILVAVFSITAFLFFLDFVKSRQRSHFVLHVLFFTLALYTKEIAVAIIPVCIFYLHFIEREKIVSYNKKVFLAGWFLVCAVWFMMRDSALQQHTPKGIFEMGTSVLHNLPALIQYAGKVLLPFNLSVMPVMQDTSFIFGFVALLVFGFFAFVSKEKRSGRILFSIIWFIVFLLPTFISTSVFRIHQPYEHRMYLPAVGILFFLSEVDVVKHLSFQKISNLIMAASVIVFFFVLTFLHEKVFSDTRSFLENAVSTSPGSSLAHRNMGIYYQDKNMLKEASEEYLKSLALNPHEKDLHNNLGVIYDSWSKKELAEKEYLTETQLNPDNGQAFHNLGVICAERNENEKAEKYFRQALSVRQNKGSLEQLALLYKKMNRKDDFERVVKILRENGARNTIVSNEAHAQTVAPAMDPFLLGKQLMQSGKMQEAEAAFKQALVKDSMNREAYFNLGLIYYSVKQLGMAEAMWRKAVSIDPTYVDASNNLAICLAQQGKNAEAEVVLKKIISSNPGYIDGYFNMANFYARTGKEKDALVCVKELKKRGITKDQFVKRGIKLSPELEKVFSE